MRPLNDAPTGLNSLTAFDAAARVAAGEITSESLVSDCLTRIQSRNEMLGAWIYLDADYALAQARRYDQSDGLVGPLHGVPVGVKDVLDTYDMPTEYGSNIYKGHRPIKDAACVAALRAAGAVILGKTTTTQFASPLPVGVRNPHDVDRTAGVSSSGSAAAVADFMVPLANGTQTGGSVILPASFCGLVGYKASLNGLDRTGIAGLKKSLDTLGYFSRCVEDIKLVYEAVTGFSLPEDPVRPDIGVCRTPLWDEAESCAQTALEEAASKLSGAGYNVRDICLPPQFDSIEQSFRVISNYEGKYALADEFSNHMGSMNSWMQKIGNSNWSEKDYYAAVCAADTARSALGSLLEDTPILLAPSTAGEAPPDLESMTMSSFNRMWTLMHGPTMTLPVSAGPNSMPVGIQIVAGVGEDAALIARSLEIMRVLQSV